MDSTTARVLELVDERADDLLGELTTLLAIPSVSGTDAENEALAHLADVFAARGLDVDHWLIPLDELAARADFPGMEVDRREAWGLVGRLPGRGGPTLMFNGHVDVVPPGSPESWSTDPFTPTTIGGRLFGRGSCDMKGGLIAALWATEAIRRAGVALEGDIVIAAVLGEEDGGLGTFATLARGWTADACVIPEPTDLDLVPANAGSLTFRLIVRGHATHAARRTAGVSAIDKFVPLLGALAALETRRNVDPDPLTRRWAVPYPISVGTLRAGDWASSVPDELVAEGRLGVILDEAVDEARAALEAAVAEVCASDPWLAEHPVEVEWWGGQFASGRSPDGGALAARVEQAHVAAGGRRPETWAAPYGSDLRLLTSGGRIPTVQYGPGDVAVAHGPDEHVALADVRTTARTLAVLALDVCGGPATAARR